MPNSLYFSLRDFSADFYNPTDLSITIFQQCEKIALHARECNGRSGGWSGSGDYTLHEISRLICVAMKKS
jgi:hypothetical protein